MIVKLITRAGGNNTYFNAANIITISKIELRNGEWRFNILLFAENNLSQTIEVAYTNLDDTNKVLNDFIDFLGNPKTPIFYIPKFK